MKLSLIIPVKDLNDPNLPGLLGSIESQWFPSNEVETLLITEGTSESAKAIGIRRAKGEVIGILATDNELMYPDDLIAYYEFAKIKGAAYPLFYEHKRKDDALNRYFALIGGNDPLSFYMDKNDRLSYADWGLELKYNPKGRTLGDNGFFVRRNEIMKTDLDNYYHIDNANELTCSFEPMEYRAIWHKTGGNIFKFFKKRYRYGLQHAFNKNRRWHLVDFRCPKDIVRFLWFILATVSLIPTLYLSIRGFLKIRDVAWFLHPIVCLMTVFTYGILTLRLLPSRLSQLLFAPSTARRA